jgi:hypothetical protein
LVLIIIYKVDLEPFRRVLRLIELPSAWIRDSNFIPSKYNPDFFNKWQIPGTLEGNIDVGFKNKFEDWDEFSINSDDLVNITDCNNLNNLQFGVFKRCVHPRFGLINSEKQDCWVQAHDKTIVLVDQILVPNSSSYKEAFILGRKIQILANYIYQAQIKRPSLEAQKIILPAHKIINAGSIICDCRNCSIQGAQIHHQTDYFMLHCRKRIIE